MARLVASAVALNSRHMGQMLDIAIAVVILSALS
jgi:hypothetical protein